MSQFNTGTLTVTSGSVAEDVAVGFAPDKVVLWSQNATTGEKIRVDWFGSDMGDSKQFHTVIVADDGTTSDTSAAYVASGGVVITKTGSTPSISNDSLTFSGEEGFTIAVGFIDTSDVLWWEAYKS